MLETTPPRVVFGLQPPRFCPRVSQRAARRLHRSSDCGKEGLEGRRATKANNGRGAEEVTRKLAGGREGRGGEEGRH